MSVESGSSRTRGLRLALAALVTLAVITAVVVIWPDGASAPRPIEPSGAPIGEAPASDAPAPDTPEAEPVRVDQPDDLALSGQFPHPPRHPTWRAVTGTTRREDTGFPVNCSFTPLDENGEPLEVELRSLLAGAFHVLIPPDAVTLEVSARHNFDLQDVLLDLPRESGLSGANVVLPLATGQIKGQVVDPTGSGLARVRIDLNGSYAHRTSGPTGAFYFRPLRDGSYFVSVAEVPFSPDPPPRITVRIEKGQQQEPAMFIVQRGGSIRGVVRSESTAERLGRVRILLAREDDREQHRTQLTDEDGSFHFERLDPGSYRVTANSGDGIHGRVQVTVPDLGAEEDRRLALALRPGAGSLEGQLTDGGGKAVPFATIVASLNSESQLTTHSDTRGQFGFRSLAPGTWTIGVQKQYCESNNWIAEPGATVEIRTGDVAHLNLEIHKGKFLEGQVLSDSKHPGLTVRLRTPSGAVVEEIVGDEGRFAFGGLSRGTYFLEVVDPFLPEGAVLAQQGVLITSEKPDRLILRVP